MSVLKLCPFCGTSAAGPFRFEADNPDSRDYLQIECNGCEATMSRLILGYISTDTIRQELIAAWNTRAPQQNENP